MTQLNDQLPVADIPDVYRNDPYALQPGSPLLLAAEEVRATVGTGEQEAGTIRRHDHNGSNSRKIVFSALAGLFKVAAAAPTGVPRSVFDQIVLYSSGGTYRVYFYVTDSMSVGAWRYVALT
jgi:hypothetical protein